MRNTGLQTPLWSSVAVIVFLLLLPVSGCGSSGPEVVRVYGRVTFNDAAPPAAGTLYFLPFASAPGGANRPASASFDEQGNYEVKAYGDRKGLPPGRYRVFVECWKTPPTMDGPPEESHVPEKFQSAASSELELTIEPGAGTREFHVNVTGP
ncbi:MAG: hypothetical protein KDA42_04675 [Planctomycetales bacterium]|nr:hypothetical protein [Planctomycetales bacterium]